MVEKSTVDKKQPELYLKLKRVDPKILKKVATRIDPRVEAADRALLERLAETPPGPKILSIYVDLDPAEFPTPHQRQSEVISLVDQAEAQVEELEEHDRKELRKDVQKVRAWILEHSEWDDRARGIAIFVSNPRDLFEIVKVAVPLRSLFAIEESPYIEPLTLVAPSRAICVALIERAKARIFCGTASRTTSELDEIFEETDDDVPGRHDQGGWSQLRYQHHIEDHVDRHLQHVAAKLLELYNEGRVERLVVGCQEETLPRVLDHLHSYLRERFAGRIDVDYNTAGADELERLVGVVLEEEDRRREAELFERLRRELAVGGRAVYGLEDTLAALNEARVEVLFTKPDLAEPGVFCPRDGWLGVAPHPGERNPLAEAEGSECPLDGTALEETANVVEKAVERTITLSAETWAPRYDDELDRLGGIAALLRF
jgi:peptide chain release factor subunit 1